jgi:hypothetical protein
LSARALPLPTAAALVLHLRYLFFEYLLYLLYLLLLPTLLAFKGCRFTILNVCAISLRKIAVIALVERPGPFEKEDFQKVITNVFFCVHAVPSIVKKFVKKNIASPDSFDLLEL